MNIYNLDKNAVIKWRLTDACNYRCPYCIRRILVFENPNFKVDEKKCFDALPYVVNLAEQLYKNTGKKVKIDLIGGEVTIFDKIKELISKLQESEFIEKINVTTNFSKPLDWLINNLSSEKLSLTASYHPEQCRETIKEFCNKAAEFKPYVKYIKCETVYTFNCEHTVEFAMECENNNLEYQIEEDLFDKRLDGRNCSSTKKNFRYKVIDNENVSYFLTRNEFLKKQGAPYVITENLLCSRDFDYIYIEKDMVMYCYKRPEHIKNFNIEKDMHLCYRNNKRCSICGNISLLEMKNE